ncbi:MAG TPA: BON domain-containing protein [Spongiibacteraceae bacterium]|nr:BON domain-containing protein [Spongiibacteraceae bacterium]
MGAQAPLCLRVAQTTLKQTALTGIKAQCRMPQGSIEEALAAHGRSNSTNVISFGDHDERHDITGLSGKGWITPSGKVDWYFQRSAAEHAVRKLSGVMALKFWWAVLGSNQ